MSLNSPSPRTLDDQARGPADDAAEHREDQKPDDDADTRAELFFHRGLRSLTMAEPAQDSALPPQD
jgi:hypothetical protein